MWISGDNLWITLGITSCVQKDRTVIVDKLSTVVVDNFLCISTGYPQKKRNVDKLSTENVDKSRI